MTLMNEPSPNEIVRMLERRVKENEALVDLRVSTNAKIKAKCRLSEAAEILGLVREYVKHPERI